MHKLGLFFDKLPPDDRLLVSHIADLAEISQRKYISRFTAFLDERQAALAETAVNTIGYNHCFYGGYEGAARVLLGVFPEYEEPENNIFPIAAIVFRYKKDQKLSHRDFLGAMMSCGINRNMVGDIIVNDGYTVAFVYDTVAQVILSEVSKIGSVGVKTTIESSPEINIENRFSEITGTVSSLRADCVLSMALKLSREKTAQYIRSGNVSINYENNISVSNEVKIGDVFSVRGHGKYILAEVNGKTKKDRIHIKIKKYI